MKQNITITLDAATHKFLIEEAKRRKMSMKKLGEEYFDLMVERLLEKKNSKSEITL